MGWEWWKGGGGGGVTDSAFFTENFVRRAFGTFHFIFISYKVAEKN